jgi:hypothetical protein
MAECLIFNQDNTHEDILISERDCYKQGDVIVMMPDNHPWGTQEHPNTATNPKFWLVKLLNVDAETVLYLTSQYTQPKQDMEGTEILLQRLWKFDITQLSIEQLSELTTTGQLTLDWNIVEPMFINKITGTN